MTAHKSLPTPIKLKSKLKSLHASSQAPYVNISTKTPPEFYRRRSEKLYNLATPFNYSPVFVHEHKMATHIPEFDCTGVQWKI